MAEQLNVASMSLNDSQHAPTNGNSANGGPPNGFGGQNAYIPPHMRNAGPGVGEPAMNGDSGAWPVPQQRE